MEEAGASRLRLNRSYPEGRREGAYFSFTFSSGKLKA
jgi:hypothetical protein